MKTWNSFLIIGTSFLLSILYTSTQAATCTLKNNTVILTNSGTEMPDETFTITNPYYISGDTSVYSLTHTQPPLTPVNCTGGSIAGANRAYLKHFFVSWSSRLLLRQRLKQIKSTPSPNVGCVVASAFTLPNGFYAPALIVAWASDEIDYIVYTSGVPRYSTSPPISCMS